jgi:hypothetical protein
VTLKLTLSLPARLHGHPQSQPLWDWWEIQNTISWTL